MLDAVLVSGKKSMTAAGATGAIQSFEEEVTRSLDWVAQGCPPDPVRGFIPSESGEGGSLRLMNQQSFSDSGVMTWDAPIAVPTP